MQILSIGKSDVEKYQERIKLDPILWHTVEQKREATANALNPNGSVNYDWIRRKIAENDKYYKGTTDITYFHVNASDWTRGGVLGVHLGRVFHNSRVCIVRNRTGEEDTVEHEFLHAIREYIYIHSGKKLEKEFGVSSFDDYYVHAEGEGRVEYEYQDLYPTIKPLYLEALEIDNSNEYRGLLFEYRRLLRRQLSQLRNYEDITV